MVNDDLWSKIFINQRSVELWPWEAEKEKSKKRGREKKELRNSQKLGGKGADLLIVHWFRLPVIVFSSSRIVSICSSLISSRSLTAFCGRRASLGEVGNGGCGGVNRGARVRNRAGSGWRYCGGALCRGSFARLHFCHVFLHLKDSKLLI